VTAIRRAARDAPSGATASPRRGWGLPTGARPSGERLPREWHEGSEFKCPQLHPQKQFKAAILAAAAQPGAYIYSVQTDRISHLYP
jgi:hypothetical protein